jgi:hypothetical protein
MIEWRMNNFRLWRTTSESLQTSKFLAQFFGDGRQIFRRKWDVSQQKGVACLKVRIREEIGTCPKQHDWLRKFIHIFHGHLKCFGCSTIFTHAVIKKQKHRAWRFASVAFCCHSCKGDNKVASSSSSTTTTNYSSTSHHLTISHKTSPIHHKLQSCFLLLKAAREKSDVCTKVKHHSHHRTVGFEAVGIPQIMCYPMLLLCRYLRDTHFLYTSSASSTNNSHLAYHTAVLWLVISIIMSFDYRFNYQLCIYIYMLIISSIIIVSDFLSLQHSEAGHTAGIQFPNTHKYIIILII